MGKVSNNSLFYQYIEILISLCPRRGIDWLHAASMHECAHFPQDSFWVISCNWELVLDEQGFKLQIWLNCMRFILNWFVSNKTKSLSDFFRIVRKQISEWLGLTRIEFLRKNVARNSCIMSQFIKCSRNET